MNCCDISCEMQVSVWNQNVSIRVYVPTAATWRKYAIFRLAFPVVLGTTAIIPLNSTNRLVFVMRTQCVFLCGENWVFAYDEGEFLCLKGLTYRSCIGYRLTYRSCIGYRFLCLVCWRFDILRNVRVSIIAIDLRLFEGGIFFFHLSRPALGPTQPSVQWVPALFPGIKAAMSYLNNPHPPSAQVKERVDQYVCFTSGPSLSVLVWTLPYLFTK
jgi:hypothetical protein